MVHRFAGIIRDQILFLSGKLNRKMYGESVKPPQPPGLWKAVSMAAPFTLSLIHISEPTRPY